MSDGKLLDSASDAVGNQQYKDILCKIACLDEKFSSVENFHEKLARISDRINAEAEQAAEFIKQLSDRISFSDLKRHSVSSQTNANLQSIESIKEDLKHFRKDFGDLLESVDMRFQKQSDNIDSLSSEFVKKKEHKDSIEFQLQLHEKHKQDYNLSLKSCSKNEENISNVISSVMDLDRAINELGNRVSELKDLLDKYNKEASERIKSLSLSYESKIEKLSDKVIQDIQFVKDEIIGSPSSLQSVKNEIFEKLEMASFDAQNAVLKSNNVDQQIKVQERKIENIILQIKKYELTK